jgi:hypothetical protein
MTSRRSLFVCPLLACLPFALGCVSTDDRSVGKFALCASRPTTQGSSALVLVASQMQEGLLRCSGVAIAPSLVVTSLACTYRPSSVGDPDPAVRRASKFFAAGIDLERVCDPARAWAPVEDGSFSAAFGKPLDPSAMSVYLASDVERTFAVKSVFASGATSPCAPGLALLELEREIAVSALPVRLADGPLEEAVSLGGHCAAGRYIQTHVQPSSVVAMTAELGSEQAPPWSLLLPGGSLDTDIGGAVVSAQTGALVGVIVSGSGSECSALEPGAQTFAVRIAAFRSLLLETARARGIDLRVEALATGVPDPDIPACAEPPVQP